MLLVLRAASVFNLLYLGGGHCYFWVKAAPFSSCMKVGGWVQSFLKSLFLWNGQHSHKWKGEISPSGHVNRKSSGAKPLKYGDHLS